MNQIIFPALVLLSSLATTAVGQTDLVEGPEERFFQWFGKQSQAKLLYEKGSRLYVFNGQAPLQAQPYPGSEVLLRLPVGLPVLNLSFPEEEAGLSQHRGYQDFWYRVAVLAPTGQQFTGYLWGGDLAKGWTQMDLDADGQAERLLLGVGDLQSSIGPYREAEIKVLKDKQVHYVFRAQDLCVSEDCASSALIRSVPDKIWPGLNVLEVSTVNIGCELGVQRSFFRWSSGGLVKVYHRRWSEKPEAHSLPFEFRPLARSGQDRKYICRYSHQDDEFNPVWRCFPIGREKHSPELPPAEKPSRARR